MSSFSLWAKMLGKVYTACSPNLNFLGLAVFKILQFKINNFHLTHFSVTRRLTFGKVGLNLLQTQLIYNSEPLLCFDDKTAKTSS